MKKYFMKKYFRCNVCNDIHYGMNAQELCPTCGAKNAYVAVERQEALAVMSDKSVMDREAIRNAWKNFADGQDFELNQDKKHVDMVLDGVLANEKKHGLKLCPCRLPDGTRERDIELICPCNFKIQDTWTSRGDCWCGLFVKR